MLFTVNPVNGKRDETMITATWGLGEAIVSGAVTPDTLTVAKATGKLIRRETAEKQVMTVRTETGTSEVPVPDSQKKKAVLTNKQAAELTALGRQIEQLYAMPMDIEWTLAGGKFAIVQARPITALLEPRWSGRCRIRRRCSRAAALPSSCRSRFHPCLPRWLSRLRVRQP